MKNPDGSAGEGGSSSGGAGAAGAAAKGGNGGSGGSGIGGMSGAGGPTGGGGTAGGREWDQLQRRQRLYADRHLPERHLHREQSRHLPRADGLSHRGHVQQQHGRLLDADRAGQHLLHQQSLRLLPEWLVRLLPGREPRRVHEGASCMNWGFESGTAEGWGMDTLNPGLGVTNITVSSSHFFTQEAIPWAVSSSLIQSGRP